MTIKSSLDILMSLSQSDVQEILRLLDDTCFDEMHLEVDGLKIYLSRSGGNRTGEFHEANVSVQKQLQEANTEEMAPQGPDLAPAVEEGLVDITAPMLGIFYSAPKPGAGPFVQVGNEVKKDTVVCIIEVMKLMNSVQSGVSGEIVEVHAEDGQLVEYGQLLFRVKGLPGEN